MGQYIYFYLIILFFIFKDRSALKYTMTFIFFFFFMSLNTIGSNILLERRYLRVNFYSIFVLFLLCCYKFLTLYFIIILKMIVLKINPTIYCLGLVVYCKSHPKLTRNGAQAAFFEEIWTGISISRIERYKDHLESYYSVILFMFYYCVVQFAKLIFKNPYPNTLLANAPLAP